jgi:hypothetical protein
MVGVQRVIQWLLWAFVALMAADLVLTLVLLYGHPGVTREDNPLVAFWLAHDATWVVVVSKVLLTVIMARGMSWLAKWVPRQVIGWLSCYVAIMAVVVGIDVRALVLVTLHS